jgi:hypothetical protein
MNLPNMKEESKILTVTFHFRGHFADLRTELKFSNGTEFFRVIYVLADHGGRAD